MPWVTLATRRTASHDPRRAPWIASASSAYWEHDGWNRHRGGRWTETSRQTRIGACSTPGCERTGGVRPQRSSVLISRDARRRSLIARSMAANGRCTHALLGTEQVGPAFEELVLVAGDRGAQPAAHPVAIDRGSHRATDGVGDARQPRGGRRRGGDAPNRLRRGRCSGARPAPSGAGGPGRGPRRLHDR